VTASSDHTTRLWSVDDDGIEGGDQLDRVDSKVFSVAGSTDTNFIACG